MISFIVFTAVAFIAVASVAKILFFSIQRGQWLDKLLNWQDRLRDWDIAKKYILSKPLGLCEMCFSNFVALLSIPFYLCFMWQADAWVLHSIIGNVLWIVGYHSIATMVNLYFLTQLFPE